MQKAQARYHIRPHGKRRNNTCYETLSPIWNKSWCDLLAWINKTYIHITAPLLVDVIVSTLTIVCVLQLCWNHTSATVQLCSQYIYKWNACSKHTLDLNLNSDSNPIRYSTLSWMPDDQIWWQAQWFRLKLCLPMNGVPLLSTCCG